MGKTVTFGRVCPSIMLLSVVLLCATSPAYAFTPHAQFESGVPLAEILCSDSHTLLESPRGTPACVRESSVENLMQRGFVQVSQTMSATQDEPVFVEERSVTVLTDKKEYDIGETVRYTIINTGTVEATFGDTAYGFNIKDLYGNVVSHYISGPAEVHLQPGERADGSWSLDYYGDVVPPGPYVINAGAGKSEPFTITHDNPAFFEPASIDGYSVTVLTDKQEYKLGEPVRWAIVNTGTIEMSFETFHNYVIMVEDSSGDFVSARSGSAELSLEPGERIDDVWKQLSFYGDQLPTGTYVINAGKFQSEPFIVIQDEPAAYEPTSVYSYSVTVLRDKQEYKLGETVRYSIINTGGIGTAFNDPYYGFRVEDLHGNVVASQPTALGDSYLQPTQYVNGTWNQGDFTGKLLPAGTYVITADTGKSEPFTIIQDKYVMQGESEPVYTEGHSVIVLVGEQEYAIDETISYIIKNTGTTDVSFSNSMYGFSVRDLSGHYITSPAAESTTVWLKPDQYVSKTWHSRDTPPGTYVITADEYSSVPFTVINRLIAELAGHPEPSTIHDNPAFFEPASVNGHSVAVLTDKQEYNLGETVRWAIENTGTVKTSFETFHNYGIMIEDGSGNFVSARSDNTIPTGPDAATRHLDSGGRIDGVWNQYGFYGDLLPAGTYIINAGGFRSEPFVVIQDTPASHEPTFVYSFSVTLLTDKQEYKLGETVRYSIINTGHVGAAFRDPYYGFRVEDLHGNVVASQPTAFGNSYLQPGKYANGTWDQGDFTGKSLPVGTYVITADTGKSEPFTIIQDKYAMQDEFEPVYAGDSVIVHVHKQEYAIDETISYTIKNMGNTDISFSNNMYGFSVRDLSGHYIANPAAEPTTVWLKSDREVYRSWASRDTPPGTYVITADGYRSVPFTVLDKLYAEPAP